MILASTGLRRFARLVADPADLIASFRVVGPFRSDRPS